RVEVGLADFEVNDRTAFGFECLGLRQHFKSRFRSEDVHSVGKLLRHGFLRMKRVGKGRARPPPPDSRLRILQNGARVARIHSPTRVIALELPPWWGGLES